MINESGLYSLILTSTKPEAKAFKRWITHEVLPSIRKAGRYTVTEQAEKDLALQRHHRKIAELQAKRSQINEEIRKTRETFYEILYTDPNQMKLPFTQEAIS